MSDILKTVKIVTDNGAVIINETDYDPDKHTLASGEAVKAEPVNLDASAITASISGAPTPPASPTSNDGQRLVSKQGKKFFVVNAAGEKIVADGIDVEGYGSEKEAWEAAIPNLGGNNA